MANVTLADVVARLEKLEQYVVGQYPVAAEMYGVAVQSNETVEEPVNV